MSRRIHLCGILAMLGGCEATTSQKDPGGFFGPKTTKIWRDSKPYLKIDPSNRTPDAKIPKTGSDAFNGYLFIRSNEAADPKRDPLAFVGETTVRVNYWNKGSFRAETTKMYAGDGTPYIAFATIKGSNLLRSSKNRSKGPQFTGLLNGTFHAADGTKYEFNDILMEGGFVGENLGQITAVGSSTFTLGHTSDVRLVEFDALLIAKVHGR